MNGTFLVLFLPMNGGIYYPSRVDPQVVGSLVMEPLSKSKVKGATLGSTSSIRMHGSGMSFFVCGIRDHKREVWVPLYWAISWKPARLGGIVPRTLKCIPLSKWDRLRRNYFYTKMCKYVRAFAYLIICNTYYTCTYLSMGWFKEHVTGTPPIFGKKTDVSCSFSLQPINQSIVFCFLFMIRMSTDWFPDLHPSRIETARARLAAQTDSG